MLRQLILSRSISTSRVLTAKKKVAWVEDVTTKSSIDKALEHFDDLYASVFTTKWPSIRLGLLSTQKFIAVPNSFTENVHGISKELEAHGAFDLKALWSQGKEKLKTEREELSLKKEMERLQELDKTLESIARTKVAEEMDTLYKNAPDRNAPVRASEGVYDDRRVLRNVREASAEFVTPTKLKGIEEFQFESEYYSYYSDQPAIGSDSDLKHSRKDGAASIFSFTDPSSFSRLNFPFIKPYTFEPGNTSTFPSAGKDQITGLRKYLCVNGASLAPIIALDLKPGVNVLDLCAGPGTKSLLALMTHCPRTLTCNDLQSSRLARIYRIFEEFVGVREPDNVKFTQHSAVSYPASPDYERVLADVPCSSDRTSVTVTDNNVFRPTRTKERLGVVPVQKSILLSAFKCLTPQPGSSCVYSTCTMSPIENDGTVAAALKETDVESLTVDLMGLWEALLPLKRIQLFNMSRTKFGVLIEPTVFSNFGPMYISRIVVQPNSLN